MSFIFKCTSCGTELEAKDEWDGIEAQCPTCMATIYIQNNGAAPQSHPEMPGSFMAPATPEPQPQPPAPPAPPGDDIQLLPGRRHPTPAQTPAANSAPGPKGQQSAPAAAPVADSNQLVGKSHTAYMLLGVFFGFWGVHDFYAGYIERGIIKLLICILSCGILWFVSYIWAIVDVCQYKFDAQGNPFED